MNQNPSLFRRIKRKIRDKRKRLLAPIARAIVNSGLENLAARIGLYTPKVVKCMDGGLASQMIMLAQGYYYAKERNLPLYLDLDWYRRSGKDIRGVKNRPFHLFDIFPEIKKAYEGNVVRSSKFFQFLFSNDVPTKDGSEYLAPRSLYLKAYTHGIEHLLHHIDDMKLLFRFGITLSEEEKSLAEQIDTSNSCALHIRKGDFVGSMHDVCTDSYYLNAITRMQELVPDCVFFVFSNDEAYAHNLANQTKGNFIFITNRSETTPAIDMWLMQCCKHAIIPNSGFSLVPAILSYSTEKKVIMPSMWNKHTKVRHPNSVLPLPGWECLEC